MKALVYLVMFIFNVTVQNLIMSIYKVYVLSRHLESIPPYFELFKLKLHLPHLKTQFQKEVLYKYLVTVIWQNYIS